MQDKLQTLQGLVVRLLSEKQLHPDISAAAAAVSTSALMQHTIARGRSDMGVSRDHVNADQLINRVTAADSQGNCLSALSCLRFCSSVIASLHAKFIVNVATAQYCNTRKLIMLLGGYFCEEQL